VTVYVDPLMNHGWVLHGRPTSNCHMFTDGALEELHALAQKIGLRRAWFQDKRVPHYDLTPLDRAAAIAGGAIEVDRRRAVQIWRASRGLAPRTDAGK
jgi:hypothetical protein